ncbi:MAG: TonB-dependent receptor [Pseudomonadota bacterium]
MNKHLVLKQSVVAVAMTLVSSQVVVLAQTAVTAPSATVYITGSNLKRTAKEGTSPVTVITAKDIRDSGAATVTELMRNVPSMGSDTNLDTNDGGFSRGVSTASLRGLSSTATLILLNGRRMTPSAYADPNNGNSTLYDLNSIPLSALDRVEILKDGASAVYGSDAIGGVINFITKTNYEGLEVSARASANDDGKFGRKGANFFFGKGDVDTDGYNFFVTADISNRDRVARTDVKDIAYDEMRFANNRFATPFGSNVSASPSFYRETSPGSGSFTATRANMATRLVTTLNCPVANQLTGTAEMGIGPTSTFSGRTFCNYDTVQFLEGMGAGKDASAMTRGVMKLGSSMKAFAEMAITRSQRDYTGAPISLGQGVTQNFTSASVGAPYQTILPIGHPDNPFPANRASIGYRFENIGAGTQVINTNTRFVGGLNGSIAKWDWESAFLYNQSKKDETYYGRLYLPTLRHINAGATIASVAADPTLARNVVNDNKAAIMQWDAKANTTFGNLGGGAMGLAMGAEVRRETIKLTPDAELAAGNIFGLVNTIIDGERVVKSAFVELRTPFTKSFEMDFAGRFDKYPGIKTNFVPKVGAKWTVMDSLAFRGTFARGFRAPALVQVTPGGAQFFQSGVFDPKRCEEDEQTPKPGATSVDCAKSIAGTGGYNPDLKPETSKSFSLGALWSPTNYLDFGFDFYNIKKRGEVVLGSTFYALRHEDTNPGNVVRDTNPANLLLDSNGNPIPGTGPLLMVKNPWENQGEIEVQGIDIDIAFRKNLGTMGQFSAKLASSYMDMYRLTQAEGDTSHNVAGYNAGLVDWNLSSGIDVPRWKSNLTTSLTRGDHAFSLGVNYVGKVSLMRQWDNATTYPTAFCHYGTGPGTSRNVNAPTYEVRHPSCDISSWTRFNVGYNFTGFKNIVLNLNIQNVLDAKAPYDPGYGGTGSAPGVGYNEGLHNPYGRYFSVTAKYTF